MNMEVMLLGVLVVSTLVGLATEALKKLFDEYGKTYHANMLAGCVALVISLAVGVAYAILNGLAWNSETIICIIALIFISWLCAMVGYDKVIQTITQIRKD